MKAKFRITRGFWMGMDWFFVLDASGQEAFKSHSLSVCEKWIDQQEQEA